MNRFRWSLLFTAVPVVLASLALGLFVAAGELEEEDDGDSEEQHRVYKPRVKLKYQYAAKFVCGEAREASSVKSNSSPPEPEPEPEPPVAEGGEYFTSINVHNPWGWRAWFRKKVALTYPTICDVRHRAPAMAARMQPYSRCDEREFERPGPVSHFVWEKLGPHYALSVDCNALAREFRYGDDGWAPNQEEDFLIEGFLVIQSDRSLDVTGVYTMKADSDESEQADLPVTMDVEQINERVLPMYMRIPEPW